MPSVDTSELRSRVRHVYEQVAWSPHGEYHFETGRGLAEKLGYPREDLDRIPAEAVDSFAGVGYPWGLIELREGQTVLDLGSGSGMDSFLAALRVGPSGRVVGVDMTDAQLEKAESLRRRRGLVHVSFRKGFIEDLPLADGSVGVVVSNGVINLSAEKDRVFGEIARVLEPGGLMAIADIVTETQLTESITCDASLWAACIGGAAQQDSYLGMIEAAGLSVIDVRENPQYAFLSKSAQNASRKYGVKSVSLLAVKDV